MYRKGRIIVILGLLWLSDGCLKAQISPPGLGDANTAFGGFLEFAVSWIL